MMAAAGNGQQPRGAGGGRYPQMMQQRAAYPMPAYGVPQQPQQPGQGRGGRGGPGRGRGAGRNNNSMPGRGGVPQQFKLNQQARNAAVVPPVGQVPPAPQNQPPPPQNQPNESLTPSALASA